MNVFINLLDDGVILGYYPKLVDPLKSILSRYIDVSISGDEGKRLLSEINLAAVKINERIDYLLGKKVSTGKKK